MNLSMKKLIPKNKRLIESINATGDDIVRLLYVVMYCNLSMHFEKKLFKKPKKFLKWCQKEQKKIIKSIKSPFSQFKSSQMNDGIFYTVDGIPVALRHIIKKAKKGDLIEDNVNMGIYNDLTNFVDNDERNEIWEEYGKIFHKYTTMKE